MENNWKALCSQRSLQWLINQREPGWLTDTRSKTFFLFVCLWRAEEIEHLQRKQMLSTELMPQKTRRWRCFQSFCWDRKNVNASNTTAGPQNNSLCHSGNWLGAGKLQHLCPVWLLALYVNLPLSRKCRRKPPSHKSLNSTVPWSLEALMADYLIWFLVSHCRQCDCQSAVKCQGIVEKSGNTYVRKGARSLFALLVISVL